MSSNERATVKAAIESLGAELRFLPPYGPDLNPIEKAFSKLKTLARKEENRTITALEKFLGGVLDCYSPEGCANYYRNFGYATATREPL